MYGEEALKDRQCRNWFDKFHSGDFSLKDEQHSGRPNEVDDDQIKAIIALDRQVTVREIEEMLKIPKSRINRHIQRLGLVKKLDNCVSTCQIVYSLTVKILQLKN